MDAVSWPVVGWSSGWGAFLLLVFLVVRAVVKGDWIPRATHERELEASQHDANEWRAEGRIKDQAILVDLAHIKAITEETGKSTHHFLHELQKVIPLKSPEDD